MKSFALGLIGCMLTVMMALVMLTRYNIAIRRNELEQIVPDIIYELLAENYGSQKRSNREVEELLTKRIAEAIHTDSSVTVAVHACDMQKGILSARVEECFFLPSGRESRIAVARTAIVDREAEKQGTMGSSPSPAQQDYGQDAITFYRRYGSDTVFCPSGPRDGIILYATMSLGGNSRNITYRSIGWKVVFRKAGEVLQELYLLPGGNLLRLMDARSEGSLHAQLFGITLSALRGQMKEETKEAMDAGLCTISLDACMTVAIGGEEQGSMDEEGHMTGEVYDSYEAILAAQPWSEVSCEALRHYFGRSIQGLFYTVELLGDQGIQKLRGNGSYCYGSEVSIGAQLREDYRFAGWSGQPSVVWTAEGENISLADLSEEGTRILVNGDIRLNAHSEYVDREPLLSVCDLYVTLEDVQTGQIGEEKILSYYAAWDKEDGILTPGRELRVQTADQKDLISLTAMQQGGDRELMVTATDSAGHEIRKNPLLHVIDRAAEEARGRNRIRFISAAYYDCSDSSEGIGPGALQENSIWKTQGYQELLEAVLRQE